MITEEMVEAGWNGLEEFRRLYVEKEEVRQILTAALSASPAGVVKPLEWKKVPVPPSGEYLAPSAVGLYCIFRSGSLWVLRFRDQFALGEFPNLEAAKSAAFADYSARIMSAIEPAGVGVETVPPSTHVVCILQKIADEISALKLHPATSEEYDAGYIGGRNDAFAIVQEAIDNAG